MYACPVFDTFVFIVIFIYFMFITYLIYKIKIDNLIKLYVKQLIKDCMDIYLEF